MKQNRQNGFTVIEGLLILIILAMVGATGWYVWHSKQVSDKTLNAAQAESTSTIKAKKSSSSSSSKSTSTQKFFTISQWGVQAPYDGALHLLYQIRSGGNGNTVDFTSQELLTADPDCTYEYGGLLARYTASDQADQEQAGPAQMTVGQYIATDKNNDYAHIGDYYYFFDHTQAGCGSDPTKTETLVSQTNDAVKSLISGLQAIPQ